MPPSTVMAASPASATTPSLRMRPFIRKHRAAPTAPTTLKSGSAGKRNLTSLCGRKEYSATKLRATAAGARDRLSSSTPKTASGIAPSSVRGRAE
eukprot:1135902-Pyramimonas_sp.AAC.1